MTNTLAQICVDKRTWVAECQRATPLKLLQQRIDNATLPRGFVRALNTAQQDTGFGIIAEIKKASPSKGLIRADFNPATLAKSYQAGGATCLSVLTDTPYFQGRDADFTAARAACSLPMIRKDFMVDPYQIHESRALGADCILLILAALADDLCAELMALALKLGMDVLLEVHDAPELERAMNMRHRPDRVMIGINNRNLKTLQVDIETGISLAPHLDADWWVAESGISDAIAMQRMIKAGAGAFLIGESLMRQDNVEHALQTLIQAAAHG